MNPIISIVLVGAAIWGFFGFIEPRYDHIKDLKNQRTEYEGALEEVRRIEDRLAALRISYSSISAENLDRLGKILPDAVDTVQLVLDIDTVASRHGFALQNIEVESRSSDGITKKAAATAEETAVSNVPAKGHGVFAISFSVSTSYENLIGFLDDIEKSLRVLDLASLELKPGIVPNIYTVSLGFTAYYLK